MKIGFDYADIRAMPDGEAEEYLRAYNEMHDPQSGGKKMIIKKGNK